ncbi:MFS transporter [Bacillus sp. FJAT-50079]|uniref:MFS transporter n=1 Tax=Bacillus sp. FJAT-50079 TaxID=2833577 RepID=UPI001BC9E1D7|nr:MFS transporter [Bacillus sp. FJAT-50079]MBS4206666.1 MFS transporter [Bacillus sp. FJAT-50079]
MIEARKETAEHPPISHSVGTMERVGFGFGDLAINFAWASMGMFIVYFYTDVVGIGAALVGTILLVSRFLDGISDVAMGAIVDKTKSKHGKARPWILWLCVPFGIFTALLFAVPDISYTGKVIYVIVSYNLLVLIFTGVVIPYGTLNTLITPDQHQRSVLNIYRMFFANIGIIIVSNLTMPLVNAFGGNQTGWIITYSIFGAIAVFLFLITFKTTKERVQPAVGSKKNVPIKESLKTLTQNKYWVMVFLYFIIYSIGYAINQGSTIYYAEYILGSPGLVGILTLVFLIPLLIGFLVLAPIFKKYGKRNAMIGGSIISIIGSVLILIEPSSLSLVIVGQIIRGIGQVPLLGALWALLPDTIEYGEWKTGIRNEGVLYSGGSMGQKLGVGLGVALMGWILSLNGYVGGQTTQSESALFAIEAIFIYIPIVVFVAQIILLFFYKLDKEYPRIIKDLQNRNITEN